MLHIDKVVSFSMNHDLSNVKFTLYSVSINIVIKKRKRDTNIGLKLKGSRIKGLQSEQFTTVVICGGRMQEAEFNAT